MTTNVGQLIATVRKELGWTQKVLADYLHVSDRTISKWERNQGLPEITMLPLLAQTLGISVDHLLTGDLQMNRFVGGNMKNIKFYVCQRCQNVITAAEEVEIHCCGQKLSRLEAQKATADNALTVTEMDGQWSISSNHPMTKEHYISFIAFATGEQVQIIKQYPEWALQTHLAKRKYGQLFWYDTQYGLFKQLVR